MRNIPTDLLRAFVTVIDLKGYTRAGEQLGRAQPTISLQIKRLQELIGVSLFEREGGAGRLTEAGEVCAGYARRILAQHDEMMQRLTSKGAGGRLKLGLPNDYADQFLPAFLARVPAAEARFDVVTDVSATLLRDFREGLLDIVMAVTPDALAEGALTTWREPLCWVGPPDALPPAEGPLRLVVYPEGCLYRRSMLGALQRQGRAFDIVYTTSSLTSIEAAVGAGFGVTALASRLRPGRLRAIAVGQSLPALPDVTAGIYLNARVQTRAVRHLAGLLNAVIAPGNPAG
jgi:DNA-binding transcriptional LysR family regulator